MIKIDLDNIKLMSGTECILTITDSNIKILNKNLLPISLKEPNKNMLEHWLENRAIDEHRVTSRILKKVIRLKDKSNLATVLSVNAQTLTDNYWIQGISSNLEYKDIKFSSDYFSNLTLKRNPDIIGLVFNDKEKNTPELTNIGSYEKCWKLKDGKWYMYKVGTELEYFSELFCYEIGKYLGFDMLKYSMQDGYIFSENFCKDKYNYEPIYYLVYDDEDYDFNYNKLLSINHNLANEYLDIIFLDCLCMNVDRHTFNYGLLRDNKTGDILKLAPNYDNNISLISNGYFKDYMKVGLEYINDFTTLVKDNSINYNVKPLTKDSIYNLASKIKTENNFNIDIEYVTNFINYRYNLLVLK